MRRHRSDSQECTDEDPIPDMKRQRLAAEASEIDEVHGFLTSISSQQDARRLSALVQVSTLLRCQAEWISRWCLCKSAIESVMFGFSRLSFRRFKTMQHDRQILSLSTVFSVPANMHVCVQRRIQIAKSDVIANPFLLCNIARKRFRGYHLPIYCHGSHRGSQADLVWRMWWRRTSAVYGNHCDGKTRVRRSWNRSGEKSMILHDTKASCVFMHIIHNISETKSRDYHSHRLMNLLSRSRSRSLFQTFMSHTQTHMSRIAIPVHWMYVCTNTNIQTYHILPLSPRGHVHIQISLNQYTSSFMRVRKHAFPLYLHAPYKHPVLTIGYSTDKKLAWRQTIAPYEHSALTTGYSTDKILAWRQKLT
jgi:hypothetical protein